MDVPIRMCEPELVAPDTHLIRTLAGEGVAPFAVFTNSSVITAEEPVIVDCGPAIVREQWLEQVFSIVDPADVRWIYLSHDDHDHTGNVEQVLEACPHATIVTTHFMVERLMAEKVLPMDRMRWVNDGESFSAGDRELVSMTPPTFDSPTTRGLFDRKTGVYWAVDSFAAPVLSESDDPSTMDPAFYRDGFLQFQRMVSPWHRWLDAGRYDEHLDRIWDLGAGIVTSGHGPVLRGAQIADAFELLAELPHLDPVDLLGQADLEAMQAAMAAMAAPAPVAQPAAA